MSQSTTANSNYGLVPSQSAFQAIVLAVVWLTVASGAVVFNEPAPFDVLMMCLIITLMVSGLVRFTAPILLLTVLWLCIAAMGLAASIFSPSAGVSIKHSIITLYLSFVSIIIAGFVARQPERHLKIILSAYIVSAVIAAVAGVVGYFDLVPGFDTLFTRFNRARGTFKDPNVFGAYLVPAALIASQHWLNNTIQRSLIPLIATAILVLGIFLSFSRGAWAGLIVGFIVLGLFSFLTARNDLQRLKIFLLAIATLVGVLLITVVALQYNQVQELFRERASLTQSYDIGPAGRFGGQLKALNVIISHPAGIGALVFGHEFHGEDVHNVYLSMFLNAGWIGGVAYFCIVAMTLVAGLGFVLKRSSLQQEYIAIYAAFLIIALEGFVVDTDHWRHFYLFIGLIWGTIAMPKHTVAPSMMDREFSM